MKYQNLDSTSQIRHIFDNPYLDIYQVSLGGGDSVDKQFPGLTVLYALNEVTLSITPEGSDESQTINISEEKVWDLEMGGYRLANPSEEDDIVFLAFVRRSRKLPEQEFESTLKGDKQLYDGEFLKVYRKQLEPGEQMGESTASSRLIYSHSDYMTKYESDTQESVVQKFSEGDFNWHNADKHTVYNIGTTTASFTIFEFFK